MTYPFPPKPSAWMTADLRAAHQIYDQPPVFRDPLATNIIGASRAAQLQADGERQQHPLAVAMRATMAVRARLAEDSWREARQRGVAQYVVLGAGLDTYAYRSDHKAIVYEVDLPDMQRWKRDCLRAADIAEPPTVRYVASDFTASDLLEALQQAGFDASQPACFSWLGVSMYLRADAVMRTLREIAACAPGTSIVFDYCVQRQHLSERERQGLDLVATSLAAQGEPLQSSFAPELLEHMLRQFGFRAVEHFGPMELTTRYLANRSDGMRLSSIFRMVRATV